jgi:hypothetical protein
VELNSYPTAIQPVASLYTDCTQIYKILCFKLRDNNFGYYVTVLMEVDFTQGSELRCRIGPYRKGTDGMGHRAQIVELKIMKR